MKLRFEPDFDFQLRAVDTVCDLFRGQEVCRTEFTITRDRAEPRRDSPSPRAILALATG